MDISKFLVKIFGDKKSRDLKAYRPLVEMVTKAYPAIQALSNDELRARTAAIRQQIADSATDLRKEIDKRPGRHQRVVVGTCHCQDSDSCQAEW